MTDEGKTTVHLIDYEGHVKMTLDVNDKTVELLKELETVSLYNMSIEPKGGPSGQDNGCDVYIHMTTKEEDEN